MRKSKLMPKFRTQHNYKHNPVPGESEFGLSQTVPDQALSIRQIHERYIRGQPLSEYERPAHYTEDSELDDQMGIDMNALDLTEIDMLSKESAANLIRVKKLSDAKKAKEFHDAQRKKYYSEFEEKQKVQTQQTQQDPKA